MLLSDTPKSLSALTLGFKLYCSFKLLKNFSFINAIFPSGKENYGTDNYGMDVYKKQRQI